MGKRNAWKQNRIAKKQASLSQKNLALKTGISTIETLNTQISSLSLEAKQTDLANYNRHIIPAKFPLPTKQFQKLQINTMSVKLFMSFFQNPHYYQRQKKWFVSTKVTIDAIF